MSDEVKANAPATGNTATGETNAVSPNSKSESEVLREELVKLNKRIDNVLDRQANEIGELRKKVAPVNGNANSNANSNANTEKQGKVEDDVTNVVESKKEFNEDFDFNKISSSEQDAIKMYMREHLSKLPDAEKKIAKDALRNTDKFNALAKDVYQKIKTPKYIEDVLGDGAISEKGKKVSEVDDVMNAIRQELKLVDSMKNATPPSGGSAKGTVIPQSQNKTATRKYPNGGILSVTT